MSPRFASPAHYLAYVQDAYAKHFPPGGNSDPKFEQITKSGAEKLGVELPQTPYGGFEHVVLDLGRSLLASADDETRQKITQDIAIGLLVNGEANAFIARSPEGHFAVVLNSGLLLLLNKYLKLVWALQNPKDVVHCNRIDAPSLTREIVAALIEEQISIYKEYGIAYGPMVKLRDMATAQQVTCLTRSERFVLCHEIGHYLNGDLNNKSMYSALPGQILGMRYTENVDHEIEHLADVKGFELYLKTLAREGTDVSTPIPLIQLLGLFNLLYALHGGASESHPHPYDRVHRIALAIYGTEFADKLRKGLKHPSEMSKVLEHLVVVPDAT